MRCSSWVSRCTSVPFKFWKRVAAQICKILPYQKRSFVPIRRHYTVGHKCRNSSGFPATWNPYRIIYFVQQVNQSKIGCDHCDILSLFVDHVTNVSLKCWTFLYQSMALSKIHNFAFEFESIRQQISAQNRHKVSGGRSRHLSSLILIHLQMKYTFNRFVVTRL